ncbi:probable G-protein coupled receptor 139 [Hypanus sabinus]|uniref:probable G-protein coupled receptor 139 n=1 Tax=Hypanus sabinus TaxID=79690 RepID=UPI0028C4FB49|nr:probable G-protein coupled receptor 139 [Hypanus sabinus]XP_059815103.1 probable G-protein coupled receptor 139 [Hypanus sabinus]
MCSLDISFREIFGPDHSPEKMPALLDRFQPVNKILNVFIVLIGVPVNLAAIVILSRGKCGLSTCTTRYLVAMAAGDLLTVVIEVLLRLVVNHYFPWNFLHVTPVCRVTEVLRIAAADCSVWFTVTFTFDRFVAICCQKLKTKYCTGKTAAVVLTTTGVLSFLRSVPRYFLWEPGRIINNVPWFCRLTANTFTDLGWVVYDWLGIVLNPFIPFVVIPLLNALTVRHIVVASRVRKGLRGQSKGENSRDPEMESRRRSVVLLFTLSGSFILLWMTWVLNFLYYEIKGIRFVYFNDSEWIFHRVGVLLKNFSCCTNTFIYAVTQSKFREQVISAVKYPVTSVMQFITQAAH